MTQRWVAPKQFWALARTVLPWAVAVAGLAVTYLAYAPGLITPDARDQFHQAQTGYFVDIHPPIMAWLWSLTNIVIPGTEGLFLPLIALYWIGFWLLIRHAFAIGPSRGVVACVLPFTPILFNFAGTIWKDVLLFGCFLVATGIILTRTSAATARLRPIAGLIVLILLLVGSLARWNSVIAAVPLVVLALWPRPAAMRHTVSRLALCLPVVLLVWGATGKLLDATVIHAEKTGFANMLPLWDLIGMSDRLGRNLLPGSWSDQQFADMRSCYTPGNDNALTMNNDPCYFVRESLARDDNWHASILFSLWAKQIFAHPLVYLATRLDYVHALFWPNALFMFDADSGTTAFDHHSGPLFETEKRILLFCKTAPVLHFLFTVAFWMIATAIATAWFGIALIRGQAGCYRSLLLSLSAGLNLWPLAIIGPDGQLRFAYWSIAATCVALLIARRAAVTPRPTRTRATLPRRPPAADLA